MATIEESEKIRELLEEIKTRNLLVIVEGPKDVSALNSLGIVNVLSLKKPLFSVVEDVVSRADEVVLLTDLDEEGKKLYHKLSSDLQRFGVKINNKLRDFLFKTGLRQIEGLPSYLG